MPLFWRSILIILLALAAAALFHGLFWLGWHFLRGWC
jgi:hypothetical protein